MKRLPELFALFLLLLNLSEAFRAIGVLVNVESVQMSVATIGVSLLYLITRFSTLLKLASSPVVVIWIAFIALYPTGWYMVSTLFGTVLQDRAAYWIATDLMYFGLFLVALVYAYTLGEKGVPALCLLSLVVVALGFVVNYVNYGFTRKMLEYSGATNSKSVSLYRAMSFYGHPNTAAFSILIILLLLLTSFQRRQRNPIWGILLCLLSGVFILITTSRTSLTLWLITSITYLSPQISKALKANPKFRPYVYISGVFLVALVASPFLSESLGEQVTAMLPKDTVKRMSVFMSFGDDSHDQSVSIRAYDVGKYLDYIGEQPFTGYGDDFVTDRIDAKDFLQVSQNTFLEDSLIFGVPYAVFLLWAVYRTYRLAGVPKNSQIFSTAYVRGLKYFMIVIILAAWSLVGLFYMRAVCIGLGLLIGVVLRDLAFELRLIRDQQLSLPPMDLPNDALVNLPRPRLGKATQ